MKNCHPTAHALLIVALALSCLLGCDDTTYNNCSPDHCWVSGRVQ